MKGFVPSEAAAEDGCHLAGSDLPEAPATDVDPVEREQGPEYNDEAGGKFFLGAGVGRGEELELGTLQEQYDFR